MGDKKPNPREGELRKALKVGHFIASKGLSSILNKTQSFLLFKTIRILFLKFHLPKASGLTFSDMSVTLAAFSLC